MEEYQSKGNEGKAHKPAKNHPWRNNFIQTKIAEFARDKSRQTTVNSWKKGGGKAQK